jgi:type I restriction enzyme, S subunit
MERGGWAMASERKDYRLGDLTSWSSGGTPSKANPDFWGGDIPWISASSMKTSFLCDSDLKITRSGLNNGSRLADTNSILLLVRGSELHKRIPVGVATRPVAFNQDVKALKVSDEMLSDYLFWFFWDYRGKCHWLKRG